MPVSALLSRSLLSNGNLMSDSLVPGGARAEFRTRERVYITELMNDAENPRVSLANARVEPGVTTELHRLRVDEWYVIRSGAGRMEVGGNEPFEVGPGDTVVIPAGVSQRITNIGADDLMLQCICIPRFTPDTYEPMEDD